MIMVRKLKNKSQIHFLPAIKNRKITLFQVKIPFYTKITFKVVISEDKKIKKKWYGTSHEIIKKSISEKDEIKKALKKQGKIIKKMEMATVSMSDHCPQCHKHGIPKIERKNASDNRWRIIKQGEKKERPDEYYLTFDHKIDGKIRKHKVAQFIKDGFYFKKSIRKNIELDKFLFPRFLEPETLLFYF